MEVGHEERERHCRVTRDKYMVSTQTLLLALCYHALERAPAPVPVQKKASSTFWDNSPSVLEHRVNAWQACPSMPASVLD